MIIGKTGNTLCPIYWLKIYIFIVGLCLGSEEFMLIAIIFFIKILKAEVYSDEQIETLVVY